jgi:outer membrane protein assembly factor BamE (lipoprotein component of BamABCDE complex)
MVGLCGLLVAGLAGCISIGHSNLADQEVMDQIKVGETTKDQVAALLGEPDYRRTIALSGTNNERWRYRYRTSTVNPLDYILLYGFFFNGIGTADTEYNLNVFYNTNGVITTKQLSTTTYDMGTPLTPMTVTTSVSTDSQPGGTGRPVHWEDKSVGVRPDVYVPGGGAAQSIAPISPTPGRR